MDSICRGGSGERRSSGDHCMVARLSVIALCLSLSACASSGDLKSDMDRLSSGMQRLGASQERADCYAQAVGGRLGPRGREDAADIVDKSDDRDAMREGVLGAKRKVRSAFIAANMRCSLTR